MTLIEVMLATTIAAVIVAAATASVVAVTKSINESKRRALLDTEVKLLTEYVISRMQPVGGGGVRPWSALDVEPNWNGDGTDRIILFEIDDDLGECSITGVPGAVLNFTPTTPCCLTANMSGWENRQLLAVSENGLNTLSLASNNGVDSSGTCQLNFPPGYIGSGLATELDRLPGTPTDLSGGVLVAGIPTRIWLDVTTHELKLDKDTDGDGVYDEIVLADEIYDFQVALGYDVGTQDGRITNLNSTADEWLYNAPGDSRWTGGLALGTPQDLRMVKVGIAMGAPTQGQPNSISLLDNGTVTTTNRFLRATVGQAALRNLALFDL